MSSSFAASLRKLAEDALEAKRIQDEVLREEARLAKAEAQRQKRQQELMARQEARRANLQFKREKRAQEIEAARVRHEALMEERRIREETARAKEREARKVRFCTKAYLAVAVAAWHGQGDALIEEVPLEFIGELSEIGLTVRRKDELANLASQALRAWRQSVERLLGHCRDSDQTEAHKSLESRLRWLLKKGNRSAAMRVHRSINLLCRYWQGQCQLAEQSIWQAHESMQRAVESLDGIEIDVARAQKLLDEACRAEDSRLDREGLVQYVSEKVKAYVDPIGSSYLALKPISVRPDEMPIAVKANALRKAYATHIPGVDFSSFSAVEIINFIRGARGLAELEFGEGGDDGASISGRRSKSEDTSDTISVRHQIHRLLSDGQRAKDDRKRALRAKALAVKNHEWSAGMLSLVHAAQKAATNFLETMDIQVEDVEFSQLSFEEGKYFGPCIVSIGSEPPVDGDLKSAFAELRWLVAAEGREFSSRFEKILLELANKGERSVELTIDTCEDRNRVELVGMSLICKTGSSLLVLLLTNYGFLVEQQGCFDGQVQIRLSW